MNWCRCLQKYLGRFSPLSAGQPPPDARHVLGRFGEEVAGDYLKKQGYSIVGRNVRLQGGEIDVLAQSPDGALVCVEVKTRRRDDWRGEWAINARKKRQLIRLTQRIGKRRRWVGKRLRIDVIVVIVRDGRVDEIRHHPSAVTLDR